MHLGMSGSFRVQRAQDGVDAQETPGDFHHARSKAVAHDHIVFHMANGAVDGTPPLKNRHERKRWGAVCSDAYRRHRAAAEHGIPTLMDSYGALNEAEFFAPAGYQKHLDNVATAFVRILKRARASDEIVDYSDEEFEAIVHMFMGARGYLSRRYASGDDTTSVPNDVITAYEKLVTRGLFKPATQKKKS